MGFKLSIKNGAKLTIDPGKQIIIKWVFRRPDVLSLYGDSTEDFEAFVPHISHDTTANKISLTTSSLQELRTLVNKSITLKNSKIGEFNTTFADKRLFQVGVIITKPHRHGISTTRNGKKRAERLAPWENNNTSPRGAAVAWQGTPIKQVTPTNPEIKRINFSLDWNTGEIIGFDQILNINNIQPGKVNEQRRGEHEVYFFGLIFRIRNPYTNEYIKTKPSDNCIYRSTTSAFLYPNYYKLNV